FSLSNLLPMLPVWTLLSPLPSRERREAMLRGVRGINKSRRYAALPLIPTFSHKGRRGKTMAACGRAPDAPASTGLFLTYAGDIDFHAPVRLQAGNQGIRGHVTFACRRYRLAFALADCTHVRADAMALQVLHDRGGTAQRQFLVVARWPETV